MPNDYFDFDAMPARQLVSRWVITGDLKLVTAAHFGGRATAAVDMMILRCPATDRPLLPGTSLAGALRAHALDRLVGYTTELREEPVARIFGGHQGDDDGAQSPLIVFDALANDAVIEIRDGVTLDPERATAMNRKKFDYELLPPGTTFPVRFDLLIGPKAQESELLSYLILCLESLTQGEIFLGLRRSRGLGQLVCENWRAHRFNLSTPQGWVEWACSDHANTLAEKKAFPSAGVALRRAWDVPIEEKTVDKRERVIINLELEIEGELLIRSPSTDPSAPDVSQLHSGGLPVLSGTSLVGALRAQALRVVQLVHRLPPDQAESRWVEKLFGPRLKGDRDPNFKPWGSRLRVWERFIDGGAPKTSHRIAIDRFTQGVVPGALFDEAAQAGGKLELQFEIRSPQPGEVGLLLLLLRDLATGRLPLGGTSSVGRGTMKGLGLTLEGVGGSDTVKLSLVGNNMPPHRTLEAYVNGFVEAERNVS